MAEAVLRHRWSEPDRRTYETARTCLICGLEKITRHEPGQQVWAEFRAEGVTAIGYSRTPPCLAHQNRGHVNG